MTVTKQGSLNLPTEKQYQKFRNDIAKILGNVALRHFQEGFRKGGYQTDASRNGWKKRSAENPFRGKRAGRATLVDTGAMRNDLRLRYVTFGSTIIGNNSCKYMAYHNKGNKAKMSDKQRSLFWAMFYKSNIGAKSSLKKGETGNVNDTFKNMAMAKGGIINLPKREIVGKSTELERKLKDKIKEELQKLFKGNFTGNVSMKLG